MDGGSLLNQGIHYVDIMQWILGPVRSVFAKVDTVAHEIEVEDIVLATLHFENGAYATFEFTLCTYPNNVENSISILGTKGTIKIGGPALNKIEHWEVSETPLPLLAEGLAPNVYAGGMYQGSCPNHHRIYEDALNHLLEGRRGVVDPAEALKSIRIAEAIYESARTGKEVMISNGKQ
jgi:UDP-N-acetyl-2-amino-2-deoxyglucuronate dehydrogenase